jgi:hypothetical protein
MIVILVWYLLSALIILLMIWFFKFTNTPGQRSEMGDVTTEVGYSEDSTGNVLSGRASDSASDGQFNPHIDAPANCESGPF